MCNALSVIGKDRNSSCLDRAGCGRGCAMVREKENDKITSVAFAKIMPSERYKTTNIVANLARMCGVQVP